MIFRARVAQRGWARVLAAGVLMYAYAAAFVVVDLLARFGQATVLRLCGIPPVDRRRYIALDRGRVPPLSAFDGFNCNYCGYANGVLAWAREIVRRVEHYWCPVRHAAPLDGDVDPATYAPAGDRAALDRWLEPPRP